VAKLKGECLKLPHAVKKVVEEKGGVGGKEEGFCSFLAKEEGKKATRRRDQSEEGGQEGKRGTARRETPSSVIWLERGTAERCTCSQFRI